MVLDDIEYAGGKEFTEQGVFFLRRYNLVYISNKISLYRRDLYGKFDFYVRIECGGLAIRSCLPLYFQASFFLRMRLEKQARRYPQSPFLKSTPVN